MIFYHGTSLPGITDLNSVSKTHDSLQSSAVYLTPNRAYALFYIRDIEINWVTCGVSEDGIICYDERFPGQLCTLYKGVSGYLYKCTDRGLFESTATRDVWVSKSSVPVEDAEFIPDAYEEILKYEKSGEVKIIRYETLSNEQKQGVYDMMVHYIYKLDLINSTAKKAEFIKENCPAAWRYVLSHPDMRQANLDAWK